MVQWYNGTLSIANSYFFLEKLFIQENFDYLFVIGKNKQKNQYIHASCSLKPKKNTRKGIKPVLISDFLTTFANCMGEFNDIAQMLARLHELQGAAFSRQVERIASHAVFLPYKNDANILIAGGEQKSDFENLLNAARKAVSHGFRVFILPNPKGVRSADFILERKGLYKMYDLKTIQGKSSVINRLRESIGQTNRVLLNMSADYNARLLASDIKSYFEENSSANELMIFKGNKLILVNRGLVRNTMFNRIFRKMYEK